MRHSAAAPIEIWSLDRRKEHGDGSKQKKTRGEKKRREEEGRGQACYAQGIREKERPQASAQESGAQEKLAQKARPKSR